jgi:phage/plasmid-associated DNA primase
LTQAEFQQMVSGEKMSIPRKGLPTLELEWKTPGLLLGNEVPGWADVANSVNRRTVMGEFKQRVQAPDPELYKKLYKELPVLVHKCNVAYLEAVHHFGKTDIWAELPEYFHETRRNLAANVNSLTSFIMRTDKLELKAGKFMPWSDFTDLYNTYLKANRLSSVRLVGDYFETIFENLGIVFEKHGERQWRGMKTQQHYLLNIGYRDGILEQQNSDASFVADQGSSSYMD